MLLVKLIFVLNINPSKTAVQIKQILDQSDPLKKFSKSQINSVLYNNPKVFKQNDRIPPKWNALITWEQKITLEAKTDINGFDTSLYKGCPARVWQKEALIKWKQKGYRGVIEAVTGTGKTKVGIIAAADAIALGNDVLILVPGGTLLNQWFDESRQNLGGSIQIGRFDMSHKDTFKEHHLIISTIQSARNKEIVPHSNEGLLIADEVHGYGSEKSSQALRDGYKYRLGLTATYDRNDNGLDEKLGPYFSPYKIYIPGKEIIKGCGYARGLKDKILAEFRVAMIGIDFEPEEQNEYEYLDNSVKKIRTKLIQDHNCPIEPFGEYMRTVQTLSKGGHADYIGTYLARNFLNKFSERKKLLAVSTNKLDALKLLVKVIKHANRSLVFTETIESAENAVNLFNKFGIVARAFHGKLDPLLKNSLMYKFRTGAVSLLAAPKVLDEGIDVPEADVGIILAASHTKRQMIQRMGRIIRPKEDERPATFFILYIRHTSEDPECGTHESFLEEMNQHAMEVQKFSDDDRKRIFEWYKKGL